MFDEDNYSNSNSDDDSDGSQYGRRRHDDLEDQPVVDVVQLDGLVVLKIIQHCSENVPDVVTGQLLGLDVDGRLEVTSSFAIPANDAGGEEEFQLEMMTCLKDTNVDNNTVGWYQAAYLGSFLTPAFIAHQVQYQNAIPNSVVVVYDPYRTTRGKLVLKAFRLSPEFMELYGSGDFSLDKFAELDVISSDIFMELPVQVKNSHLVHGFLYEMRDDQTMRCDVDRLSLHANPYICKNLSQLGSLIDDYAGEQSKFQYYQRQLGRQKTLQATFLAKRAEENAARAASGKPLLPEKDPKHPAFKPINKPSRLESMLINTQIDHYSTQITDTTVQTINKLYLVESLQK